MRFRLGVKSNYNTQTLKMGINTGGTVLWKANRIRIYQLVTIGLETRRFNANNNNTKNVRISFDIFNLAHIIYQSKNHKRDGS